jgi:hypothetical protein
MTKTGKEDFEQFEQMIENVNAFLESENLSVLQAVLERLVVTYVSVSSGNAPLGSFQITERQTDVLIRRLSDSNRSELADSVAKLRNSTKKLLEKL